MATSKELGEFDSPKLPVGKSRWQRRSSDDGVTWGEDEDMQLGKLGGTLLGPGEGIVLGRHAPHSKYSGRIRSVATATSATSLVVRACQSSRVMTVAGLTTRPLALAARQCPSLASRMPGENTVP